MNIAVVVISGLAVLVSLVTLTLGEKRARRADKRDKERAARETIELRSSQQGRPTTDLIGQERGPERAYRFRVTNVGRSAMLHLRPELVDSSGEVCSNPLPNMVLDALQAKEQVEFVLSVAEPINRNPLFLHYAWYDETGPGVQERLSDVTIPSA